jgi:HEAT repeat protein
MPGLFPDLAPRFDVALVDVQSPRPRARLLAVQALGSPPPGQQARACEALRPLVDDPDAAVRGLAVATLGELGDVAALPAVLARFDDPHGEVRELAVIAAGRIGGERALAALRRTLRDARPEMRFQAVESYAEASPDDAVATILPLLDDSDRFVRAHTLEVLGALEADEAHAAIAACLKDGDPEVRLQAALALTKLRGTLPGLAVDVLRWALANRRAVLAVLEALRRPPALAARDEALVSDLARVARRPFAPLLVRAAAGAALAARGDARGVEALRSVLQAWRADGRSYAVELVGELGVQELAAEVAALASHPRGASLVTVAVACRRLAPLDPAARAAAERLAARDDEVGLAARGEEAAAAEERRGH